MRNRAKMMLSQNSFFVVNKNCLVKLGADCAILLSALADADELLSDNDGWFYQTIDTLQEKTGIGRTKQDRALKKLIDKGILIQENRGLPRKRHFKFNEEKLDSLVFEESRLHCTKQATQSAQNKQNGVTKTNNNKELIINNINKELNINKKIDKKSVRVEIDEMIDSTDLAQATKEKLKEWVEYRFKEIKKPLKTTRAIKKILNSEWIRLENAPIFIDECMNNEWIKLSAQLYSDIMVKNQKVFKTKKVVKKENTADAYEREVAELYGSDE